MKTPRNCLMGLTAILMLVGSTNCAGPVLLVRDVDNPGRQPFQGKVSINIPVGASANTGFIKVPAGKRLVIDFITQTAVIGGTPLPSGQQVGVTLQLTAYGISFQYYLGAMTLLGTQVVGTPAERWVGTERVMLYSDPDPNQIIIGAYRTGNTKGDATVDVAVAGHLVQLQ